MQDMNTFDASVATTSGFRAPAVVPEIQAAKQAKKSVSEKAQAFNDSKIKYDESQNIEMFD